MKTFITIGIPMYNADKTIIKALNSIPERDDIEIIIVDDCSTDNSYSLVRNYQINSEKNICILSNDDNEGVGYTVNKIIDNVSSKYFVLLGSDDYFYTDVLIKFIDEIKQHDYDIAYFNLKDNGENIYKVQEKTKYYYCGSVKAIKKSFVGKTRCPNIRCGEDYFFYQELMKKNPTEWFSDMVVKHYNYPREHSLTWETLYGKNKD